jgi:hypothetical protein
MPYVAGYQSYTSEQAGGAAKKAKANANVAEASSAAVEKHQSSDVIQKIDDYGHQGAVDPFID